MTILEPLKEEYSDFHDCYINKCKGGYEAVGAYTGIFDFEIGDIDPLINYESEIHGCAIFYEEFPEENKARVTVTSPEGMMYDGVTYALDKPTRMLFAFYHDCCCFFSQETGDSSYEDLMDSLAYEIIVMQGGSHIDGFLVEAGVELWNSTD